MAGKRSPVNWYGEGTRWEAASESGGDASALRDRRNEWFRVVPVDNEFGELDASRMPKRPPRAAPPARTVLIDRKIVGPEDLIDAGYAPRLVCSRRFVEALIATRATKWKARPARHVTKLRVGGHPVYELTCHATLGTFVDTAFHGVTPPSRAAKWGRPGSPMPPVTLAPAGQKLPLVGWTEWLDVDQREPWRALVVHRSVVEKLARTWQVPLRLEAVRIPGAVPLRGKPAKLAPERAAGALPSVASVVASLRKSAKKRKHLLPRGADPQEVRSTLARVGLSTTSGLVELLVATNGPSLFGGAITLCPVGKPDVPPDEACRRWNFDDIVREQRMRRLRNGGVDVPAGWSIFARGYGGAIYWTMNRAGVVRGYAEAGFGVQVGPDAPFRRWIADQIGDHEIASKAPGKPWWRYSMGAY